MVRQAIAAEQVVSIKRSRRIVGRRRSEIVESSRMGERNNRGNKVQNQIQNEPVQNRIIDYDRVSVHTSQTYLTEEEEEGEQRTVNEGLIEGNKENMTIEELRQRLVAERRREDEERANLARQNNELREENLRLQEQRSRSATHSRSRSSRRSIRQEPPLDNIVEKFQINEDLQDPRYYRTQEGSRDNRHEQQGERYRVRHDQNDGNEPEQRRVILQEREILRNYYERENEAERYNDAQTNLGRERERQRRVEEAEEQELQEVVRQNNHDNRVIRRKRYRALHNQNAEVDREQGRIIPQGREMTRIPQDCTEEDERYNDAQMHARDER
ncbi:trichohyalin-like [Papaver somniferum]|uniref:trichohyalin-like n=1 Tax=Papaver somniferum TaxID=3469 RepID=UPI000E6F8D85|nr:trichohyalin-like [Papaver somniferum]